MLIEELKTKIESEKDFFSVVSADQVTDPFGKEFLEIFVLDPSVTDMFSLTELLTLNSFSGVLKPKGAGLMISATKQD